MWQIKIADSCPDRKPPLVEAASPAERENQAKWRQRGAFIEETDLLRSGCTSVDQWRAVRAFRCKFLIAKREGAEVYAVRLNPTPDRIFEKDYYSGYIYYSESSSSE